MSIIKFATDLVSIANSLVFICTVRIFRELRTSVNPPVAAVAHDKMTGAKPSWIRMVDRTGQKDI